MGGCGKKFFTALERMTESKAMIFVIDQETKGALESAKQYLVKRSQLYLMDEVEDPSAEDLHRFRDRYTCKDPKHRKHQPDRWDFWEPDPKAVERGEAEEQVFRDYCNNCKPTVLGPARLPTQVPEFIPWKRARAPFFQPGERPFYEPLNWYRHKGRSTWLSPSDNYNPLSDDHSDYSEYGDSSDEESEATTVLASSSLTSGALSSAESSSSGLPARGRPSRAPSSAESSSSGAPARGRLSRAPSSAESSSSGVLARGKLSASHGRRQGRRRQLERISEEVDEDEQNKSRAALTEISEASESTASAPLLQMSSPEIEGKGTGKGKDKDKGPPRDRPHSDQRTKGLKKFFRRSK